MEGYRIFIMSPQMEYEDSDLRQSVREKANELREKGEWPIDTSDLPPGLLHEEFMTISFLRLKTCDYYTVLDGYDYDPDIQRMKGVALINEIDEL